MLMCVVVLCTSCASSKKVVYLQDVVPLKQQDIEQKYEVYIHNDDLLAIMVNSKNPELALPFNMPMVSRIDMNTTGSLLICKNDKAHQILAEQLKEHSITRKYHAIVHGNLKEDTGTVNAPIGRHPTDRKKMSTKAPNGRHAVTHYRVLERFGNFTYIECQLETGRTHQIRVHMSSIGHPILGDEIYGPAKCPYKLQGQTLHAKILGITHPSTGEYIEFDAPLPDYFEDLLNKLRKQN